MSLQGTSREVLELAIKHKQTWRNEPESKWLMGLVEEVGELAESLLDDPLNNHEHVPEHELQQIASICLNWLDMRANLEEEKQAIIDRTNNSWQRTSDYTE